MWFWADKFDGHKCKPQEQKMSSKALRLVSFGGKDVVFRFDNDGDLIVIIEDEDNESDFLITARDIPELQTFLNEQNESSAMVALRGLYWDSVDYLTRNSLGGMQNHWMRAARVALGMDVDDVRVSPGSPFGIGTHVRFKDIDCRETEWVIYKFQEDWVGLYWVKDRTVTTRGYVGDLELFDQKKD